MIDSEDLIFIYRGNFSAHMKDLSKTFVSW